jgi:hypothetical protein
MIGADFGFWTPPGVPPTLNPSDNLNWTLSGGNLTCSWTGSGQVAVRATKFVTTGKLYWEVTCNTAPGSNRASIGVANNSALSGLYGSSNAWGYAQDGTINNGGGGLAYGNTWAAGSVIAFALDMNAGKIFFGLVSGGTITWQNSGDPVAGTNAAFTNLAGQSVSPCIQNNSGVSSSAGYTANFGASAWAASSLPSGYTGITM